MCDIAIDTNIIVTMKSCVMCCLLYFVCVCVRDSANSHGTRCAGEIAMVANNQLCGVSS